MCSYQGPFHDYNCQECSKPVATDTGKAHGPAPAVPFGTQWKRGGIGYVRTHGAFGWEA